MNKEQEDLTKELVDEMTMEELLKVSPMLARMLTLRIKTLLFSKRQDIEQELEEIECKDGTVSLSKSIEIIRRILK